MVTTRGSVMAVFSPEGIRADRPECFTSDGELWCVLQAGHLADLGSFRVDAIEAALDQGWEIDVLADLEPPVHAWLAPLDQREAEETEHEWRHVAGPGPGAVPVTVLWA